MLGCQVFLSIKRDSDQPLLSPRNGRGLQEVTRTYSNSK